MEHIRRERALNIPNLLTILRIALLPALVWRFRKGDSVGALAIYLMAMLTDALDGFIARRFHMVTNLGKLLDPIADKLSLLTLLGLFVADGQIPLWVLGVILLKEMLLVVGSCVALHRGLVVSALPIGKVTTVSFILSMIARFVGIRDTADVLLGVSVALSLLAFAWYCMVVPGKIKANNTVSTK